ncbi:MAG: hypothetical protein K9H49_05500 [Bacteroidales bacterium]|nr:hypothetical protein [Bacteroidales bacterium]MCF8389578.1 hypothetical protein [Bacteroidales bacterium]
MEKSTIIKWIAPSLLLFSSCHTYAIDKKAIDKLNIITFITDDLGLADVAYKSNDLSSQETIIAIQLLEELKEWTAEVYAPIPNVFTK